MLKRTIDLLGGTIGLLFASPLLLCVALLIRATMGTPVLYRQRRPGLGGRPFELVKFRTMTTDQDETRPDKERITPLGKVLRRTSLDELPELWNVVKGDMSLVGPRPLLMEYLPLYSKRQAKRHDVKPGLTGWAQVNGRNGLTWEEKFDLDVWYVENSCAWLDLRILAKTVVAILGGRGVESGGDETMPKFSGS